MSLKQKFGRLNPRYLTRFEPLLTRYAQFGGGSADDKFDKAKSFSNTYEFYIYCFFLGLQYDKKLEVLSVDEAKTFWTIENWRPVEVVDQLYICAIAESDFDLIAIEQMDESEIKSEMAKVLNTIEGFANGGFQIIKQKLEDDEESAMNDLFFVGLLAED